MALKSLLLFACAFGAHGRCSDNSDCSLNGVCSSNGACQCDTPWTGSACDLLDVLPTIPNSGYNGTADGTSSWGGSIVEDDDGSWHMFVAEMSDHCGLGAWTTNSQVVHATSDSPLGPYIRSKVVVPLFAHNPTVHRVNKTWFMYHIGKGDGSTEPRSDCKGGYTPGTAGPDHHGSPHCTMLRSASTLDGPWTGLGEVLIDHPDTFLKPSQQWTTNPAPWFQDGSTVWFPYRNPAGYWPAGGGSERLGMAKGSSVMGPFEDLTPSAPIFPFDVEDPYLWIDRRGNFHMLTHKRDDSVPVTERGGSIGHAFSADGINWRISANSPVAETIALVDGTTVTVKKMARPQLVVVKGEPMYLSLGATASGSGDHTTTVVLPLRGATVALI